MHVRALAHRCGAPARASARPDVLSLVPLPSAVLVTIATMSLHRSRFPPEVRSDAGSFRSTGSGVTRSPASLLLLSPPTPSRMRPAAPVSLAAVLRPASNDWVSQVPGSSSSNAPRTETPPRAPLSCAILARGATAFRPAKILGARGDFFSGLTSRGSLVRAPTHRREALPFPSQGSLPTCMAAFVGRDSHPLDDSSVFLSSTRTSLSLRTSLSWSHWRLNLWSTRAPLRPLRSLRKFWSTPRLQRRAT
jgi:hypothetical protein